MLGRDTSTNKDRILIGITVVATLAIVPWLLRYERSHPEWAQESVDAIGAMSDAERSDLLASYERFHGQLSDEKRERVEALHAAALADPARAALIDQYYTWMQELDLTERDRIRSATSVERKVTTIEDLIADEEADDDSFEVDLWNYRLERSANKDLLEQLREKFRDPLRISNREFDHMVQELVDSLPDEAKKQFRTHTHGVNADLPVSEQYRLRARALLYTLRRSPGWANDEVALKILTHIESSTDRDELQSLDPEARQAITRMIVYQGVHPFRSLPRYYPSQEQVKQLFMELEREDQIKLMGLPPSGRFSSRHRLNLMFVAQKSDAPNDIIEMARGMLAWLDRPRSPDDRSGRSSRRGPGRTGPEGRRGGGSRPEDGERERSGRGPGGPGRPRERGGKTGSRGGKTGDGDAKAGGGRPGGRP